MWFAWFSLVYSKHDWPPRTETSKSIRVLYSSANNISLPLSEWSIVNIFLPLFELFTVNLLHAGIYSAYLRIRAKWCLLFSSERRRGPSITKRANYRINPLRFTWCGEAVRSIDPGLERKSLYVDTTTPLVPSGWWWKLKVAREIEISREVLRRICPLSRRATVLQFASTFAPVA